MHRNMFNRLPDNYSREGQVNNEKFHQIIYGELAEIKQVFKDIKNYQDLDKATGGTLDNIGKNVSEYRETTDDDLYRQWIKIKILANRSNGDIPVINHILETYMEDNFISIEEGWKSYLEEPAAMVINIGSRSKEIPFKVMERIKAAGVRAYFTVGSEATRIIVGFREYEFNVPYKICNVLQTADVFGGLMKVALGLDLESYTFDVLYPICNTFVTSQIAVEDEKINVVLSNEYRNSEVLFKRAGNTIVGEGDI